MNDKLNNNRENYGVIKNIEVFMRENLELDVILKGYWPNPSWEMVDKKINFNNEKKIVEVFIIGKSNGKISLQVLKNFEYRFVVKIPFSGSWCLRGVFKNGYKEIKIEIF